MKKALFWATVILAPGGSLLLIAKIAQKTKLFEKIKSKLPIIRRTP